MKQTLKIILSTALVTGALLKATPALAEGEAGEPGMAVRIVATADLDLSSSAGRRQLDARLAQAAREVCGTASEVDIRGKNAVRACRDAVLAVASTRRDQLIAAADQGATIAVTAAR